MNKVRKDLTGQIFGKWQVLGISEFQKIGNGHGVNYDCKCLGCGSVFTVRGSNLTSGGTHGCACCTKGWKHRSKTIEPRGRRNVDRK